MTESTMTRSSLLPTAAAVAVVPSMHAAESRDSANPPQTKETDMKSVTAHHDVVEYWDGGQIKVFRGFVTMAPNDPSQKPARPAMTHFFYMDEKNPSKVIHWHGSVGPVAF